MKQKTIWVIDDDFVYQVVIKKTIIKSDFFSSIIQFGNGQDAIDCLKENINNQTVFPDVILLDIEMPILDGWGFMKEMKSIKSSINCEIKIYISSSSIAMEDKEKAENNPDILGYFPKPISLGDIAKIAD